MLRSRSVPISLSVSGTPAEGYKYTGYSSEPETVQIYGEKDVVDKIEEIEFLLLMSAELTTDSEICQYLRISAGRSSAGR